jgi:hypothetical protein
MTVAEAARNTIAFVTELIDPFRIFLDLTRQPLILQSSRYLQWIGLIVCIILLCFWGWTPKGDGRLLILPISE